MNDGIRKTIYDRLQKDMKIADLGIEFIQIFKLESDMSFDYDEFFMSIASDGRLLATNREAYKVIVEKRDYFRFRRLFEYRYSEINHILGSIAVSLEDVLDIRLLMKAVFTISPYYSECAYEWFAELDNIVPCDFANELAKVVSRTSQSRGFLNRIKKDLEQCSGGS